MLVINRNNSYLSIQHKKCIDELNRLKQRMDKKLGIEDQFSEEKKKLQAEHEIAVSKLKDQIK